MSGTRTRFNEEDCGVSRAVDAVGEPWTLLILRNAFLGMKRFDEFQEHLTISPKVLANRLHKLVDLGVFDRQPDPDDGRASLYRLTEKGLDLYPVIVALNAWGDEWQPKRHGPRIQLIEKATGEPIVGVGVIAQDGHFLEPHEVEVRLGPGAGSVFTELKETIAPRVAAESNS